MEKIIESGITVNGGVRKAKVIVIKSPEEVNKMKPGYILALPSSDPMYALAVFQASGLICEQAGRLSHICVVALEMGIPCITQAKGVMSMLQDEDTIFMDASSCKIIIENNI